MSMIRFVSDMLELDARNVLRAAVERYFTYRHGRDACDEHLERVLDSVRALLDKEPDDEGS